MNKDLIRTFIAFTVGSIIGAFAATMYIKSEYEQVVQEEIASVREVAASRAGRRTTYTESDTDVNNAYSDPSEMEHSTEEEGYYEYEKISRDANYCGSVDAPHIISVEEFSEENPHFDKLTIYYYSEDDTLVDENEEIITDVNVVVGGDALSYFGAWNGDPNAIYVRNEKISVDYEVINLNKSYSDTVVR